MAERRMFAKTIIDSDAFLDMPATTQMLYFHLAMRADDDGFVNSPHRVMRLVGCGEDDLRVLIAKRFLIPFDSGLVVIKHWRIHNYLRSDRYKETTYREEKAMLTVKENGAYTLPDTDGIPLGIPDGTPLGIPTGTPDVIPTVDAGKDSIGKDSKGKVSKEREGRAPRSTRPTVEDVKAYCAEKNITIDAQSFVDYYEANGWHVGRQPMKDWQAAVRNWARRDAERQTPKAVPPRKTTFHNFEQRDSAGGSWDELTAMPLPEVSDEELEELMKGKKGDGDPWQD